MRTAVVSSGAGSSGRGRSRCSMSRKVMAVVAMCALLMAVEARAQESKSKEKPAAAPDNYDELYARYLQAARTPTPLAPGKDISWMNGLATDLRARRVNDL